MARRGRDCTCMICGKQKWFAESRIRAGGGKFCSMRCLGIWKTIRSQKFMDKTGYKSPKEALKSPTFFEDLKAYCGNLPFDVDDIMDKRCEEDRVRFRAQKITDSEIRGALRFILAVAKAGSVRRVPKQVVAPLTDWFEINKQKHNSVDFLSKFDLDMDEMPSYDA